MRTQIISVLIASCAAAVANADDCYGYSSASALSSELNRVEDKLAEDAIQTSLAQHPVATFAFLATGGAAAKWANSMETEDSMQGYQWALAVVALVGASWCLDTPDNRAACRRVGTNFGQAFQKKRQLDQIRTQIRGGEICR